MKKNYNKVKESLKLSEIRSDEGQKVNAIKLNEFDIDVFHEMVDDHEAMQESIDGGSEEYAPFVNLSEDIFGSLYKRKPELVDEMDMTGFTSFNHGLMEHAMDSEHYKSLHANTKGDYLSSAIGTQVLQQEVVNEIKQYKQALIDKREGKEHSSDHADAGEIIENVNNQKKIQDSIDDLTSGGDASLTPEEAQKLAEYQQILSQLKGEISGKQAEAAKLQQNLKSAAKRGIKKADMDVQDVKDTITTWGLDSGNGQRISVDNRRSAIERIRRSERLKKLTPLIGRMKKIAQKSKTKKMPDGFSIDDVETGRNIEKVLPSEMARLAHPVMKSGFYADYQSGSLLQYKKSSIENIGQGPVIFCHDKSGSMSGQPDDWAVAVALAMLETAQKEKRNYAYIPYESNIMSSYVKNIAPGEADPQDILDIAELGVQGGTNFMAPLSEALVCLKSDRYKKGDIVFVTDGECSITDNFLADFKKQKELLNFSVLTILINAGSSTSATIKSFSDNVVHVSDLKNPENVNTQEIFKIADDKTKFQAATNQP